MTEQTKHKLTGWIIGLFSGAAVAAPITAVICKNVYEKNTNEAVAKAREEGENVGMNAMAEYAIQQKIETHSDIYDGYPETDDINNYDVSIDDVEANEEAKERTEAHERYLDMIDKYRGDVDIPHCIIDGEKFINEQYFEKAYVNWYEEDDVFEEDLSVIDDPYKSFGVVSGRDLFKNAQERPDPDICYVRNERETTDFEISRIHGSYARMVRGELPLGETDP